MTIYILLTSLLAGAIGVAAPHALEAPAFTSLTARLLTPVSSYSSKAGDPIEAVIASPVCLDGKALPDHTTLRGVLERVHSVGLGLAHETASLEFQLRELYSPDGSIQPIRTQLTAIDNARERVDRRGVIHGIRATDTLSSRFSSRLLFAAHAHPAALIPSLAVESWLFRFPEPEIQYAAGTELQLDVRFPDSLGHAALCSQPAPAPEDLAAWEDLVSGLPAWSFSKRQPQPMDPINLLFLGSLAEIERAFQAAGWTGSQPNSLRNGLEAVRAIAEDRSYRDAPMRTLLLDDAEPDLRVQRSLNTFDKRDHMRIWRRNAEWQGRTVWAAAATQDIAATFATRPPFGFTHRIQTDVDLERDKVVRELEFTGCVDSVIHAKRPETAPAAGNQSRKGLETDSRVAVILLNSCDRPRQLELAAAGECVTTPAEPPLETRIIRRFTLTARNHLLRDNLFWRTGDALYIGWRALQNWEAEKRRRAARDTLLLSVRREDPLGAESR